MPSKRPRTRFQDIIYNVEAIRRYTKGHNKKTFVADDLVVDAVERWLGHARISTTAIYCDVAGVEEIAFAARFWRAG